MTVLSAQSIRRLCVPNNYGRYATSNAIANQNMNFPLITPFVERGTQNGKSYGLSACTYDCRIADRLTIPVGQARLAVTMERFHFPRNICGSVLDKSSWARVFVSAFNTHLDPGWQGYLTVELVNLGENVAEYFPGDPLCQIKFEWLDESTDLPYEGKYQDQKQVPTPKIDEEN